MLESTGEKISVPVKKFLLEMSMGMIVTGSSNINLIAGELKEKIKVKNTIKRLSRMLLKRDIIRIANTLSLEEARKKVEEETIIALDEGDISHQYGKKFERQAVVRDGSKEKLSKGYWLNQVTGYNPKSKESFPIYLDIYSTREEGFKSRNEETFKIVKRVTSKIGKKGLWVLDRGYDSKKIFGFFMEEGVDFIVRITEKRKLNYKGEELSIGELTEKIKRGNSLSGKGRFGRVHVGLLVGGKEYKMTLISYKGKRNKEEMLFLTNEY